MVTENIDKKAKTITLETDYDFTEFKVHKYREYFHFDFIKNINQSMGMALFFNRFNGRKYYPKEIKIENVDIEKKTIHMSYS